MAHWEAHTVWAESYTIFLRHRSRVGYRRHQANRSKTHDLRINLETLKELLKNIDPIL
jgi:hypothetical protein